MSEGAMESIVGHSRAKELFRRAFRSGRLAHAYLLEGTPGIGKEALAFAIARALLCTSRPGDGCTECSACKRVAALRHPDLWYLFPHPSNLADDAKAEMALEKATGKRVSFAFPTPASIPLGDVKLLQKDATLRPLEGAWKVFIVREAQHLTEEASNALLKTLEEAPPRTVILLTSSAPHALLPTVVSRCQRVPMGRLSVDEVGAVLVSKLGIAEDVELWARLADGSPARAWEMAKDGRIQAARALAAELVERCLDGTRSGCLATADRLVLTRDRGLVEAVLAAMLGFCRDALADRAGHQAVIQNIDYSELTARLAETRGFDDLARIVGSLSDVSVAVRGNINVRLAVLTIVSALRGEQQCRSS
jgi:DNA polymerase-3 subunit delta'